MSVHILKNILLDQDVRIFEKAMGPILRNTGDWLKIGSIVGIGEQEKITFDHRDQFAYPFMVEGREKTYYLLESEIKGSIATIQ